MWFLSAIRSLQTFQGGGVREIFFNHFFFYLLYQLISYLSSFYEQQTKKSGIFDKNKKHSFPYKLSVMPSRVSFSLRPPCHYAMSSKRTHPGTQKQDKILGLLMPYSARIRIFVSCFVCGLFCSGGNLQTLLSQGEGGGARIAYQRWISLAFSAIS